MGRDTISLGVQAGDRDADAAMERFYMPLRKLLAERCIGPYCSEVDEFAFVLRIDGTLWYWNFEGCDKLRLSRRDRYVTIDIGMSMERWKSSDQVAIAKYLVDCVESGLRLMVDKLKRSKLDVRDDQLFRDFNVVKQEFLKSISQTQNRR